MTNVIDITPNAARTAESLRAVGYSTYSAIADIVDNSLDAHADKVAISITKSNDQVQITVLDNGDGMDMSVLTEALKLGSDTEKSTGDLGKYGMGLITASWSIARRLSVVTRQDGQTLKGMLDIDSIVKSNRWEAETSDPTSIEARELEGFGESGTLITLTKCDRLHTDNIPKLVDTLKKEFGKVYRHFLMSGKRIVVNGAPVSPIDPLELDDKNTTVLYEDTEETKFGQIGIKVVMLPEASSYQEHILNYNQANQGYYFVRNQREIAAALNLGLFKEHNYLNRFRAEISFSDDLDEVMGLNFSKQAVKPTQAIVDIIDRISGQYRNFVYKAAQKNEAVDPSQKADHSGAEQVIKAKNKLLQAPKLKGVRHYESKPGDKTRKPSGEGGEHVKLGTVQPGDRPSPVRIGEVNLGEAGDLYDVDMEGRQIVVKWNVQHPFYLKMVRQYKGDKNILHPLDFLLYSLGTAELMAWNDDNKEIFTQIKGTLSNNLRTLMR